MEYQYKEKLDMKLIELENASSVCVKEKSSRRRRSSSSVESNNNK